MNSHSEVETSPSTAPTYEKGLISVASLVIDPRYQTRKAMDDDAITDYEDAIRQARGWPFPPIRLVSQIVVDGFHRIEAAKRVMADPTTPVELRKSLTRIPYERVTVDPASGDVRDEALRHALAANHTHGIRRTNTDKRRSVEMALKQWPDKSSREIARLTFTSNTFVSNVRSESADQSKVSTFTPNTGPEPGSDAAEAETLTPQLESGFPRGEVAEVSTLTAQLEPQSSQVDPVSGDTMSPGRDPKPSPAASGERASPPSSPRSYARPATEEKAKPPKDYYRIATDALGIAGKRYAEWRAANGIDKQEFDRVYRHLQDANVGFYQLRRRYENKKREAST